MKRVIALVGAFVMIAVSLAIRVAIDNRDSSSTTVSGPVVITCITELADACRSLTGGQTDMTVQVEDAATTAKAIANGTAHIDAWVTLDPWPAMTTLLAQHDIGGRTTSLASSPLEIAMVAERLRALEPTCGRVDWKCLGDVVGKPWAEVGGKSDWGPVKAGVPRRSTASGTLLIGSAATDYFGTNTFATNDFDDAFRVWLVKLTGAPAAFDDFIRFFPAQASAVGVIEAQARTGAHGGEVAFIQSSSMKATVTITDFTGRAGRVNGDLRKRLGSDGWQPPADSGLPSPGVLLALSGLTG